jgi:hypothetical protein
MVLSCVDVEQFGTPAGDKSQKRGDKSRQPLFKLCMLIVYTKYNALYGWMAHPTEMAHLAKTSPLLTTINNVATN